MYYIGVLGLNNNNTQSYFTLEDIAHTMNIQREHTTRVEGLHVELKNTKGKRLMKSKMNINIGERYPHPIGEYFGFNFHQHRKKTHISVYAEM